MAVTNEQAIDLARGAIAVALVLGTPVLVVGMAVGLVVGLLQAMTQVHEQTLSFVPRIVVTGIALVVLLPWMATRMLEYAGNLFQGIAGR